MKVKFKRLDGNAVLPAYAKPGDAGMDLTALSVKKEGWLFPKYTYSTGLAVEFPMGNVALAFPRSSIHKYFQVLTNSVGVIDSGYRGEIKAVFRGFLWFGSKYKPGDRICQLVFIELPDIEIEHSFNLSETERGTGGFGSSGK